jgi:hypothetical protein
MAKIWCFTYKMHCTLYRYLTQREKIIQNIVDACITITCGTKPRRI